MMKYILPLLLFITFSIQIIICEFSLDRISKCYDLIIRKLKDKSISETKMNNLFFLYYANNGAEGFNVIDSMDIQRLKHLVQCVEIEDKSFFEDRSAAKYHYYHGGSNVTYLTGMLQKFMPYFTEVKLKDTLRQACSKMRWDNNQLGIRSIQYLSFEKAGLNAYIEKQRLDLMQRKQSDQFFVIYPDIEAERKARSMKESSLQSEVDPESDEVVSKYLHESVGTSYTVYISLSERKNFVGGEILSRDSSKAELMKKKSISNTISLSKNKDVDDDIPIEDEDLLDNDEIKIEDGIDDNEKDEEEFKYQGSKRKRGLFKKYDPVTTEITRFTPEKYSALILNASTPFGMRPILYGARKILVIEYWSYMDAKIGSTYPDLKDAIPWPRSNDEL